MKKFIFIIIFTTLLADSLVYAFNKGGRTALQFTKIGIGARQSGMGEACISIVRDVNSVFWNPANLSGIQLAEASFNYNRWFADMNYLSGAAAYRLKNVGVFALYFSNLDYQDLQEALVTSPTGSADTRTGATFGGGDMMVGLGVSRDFTDKLSIGINAKYLREDLFDYEVGIMAFDIGTYYKTGYKGIRIAMSAQNFSTGSVSFLGEEKSDRIDGYDIPLIFRVGASFDLIGGENGFFNMGENHYLQVGLDAINSNDYGERYHIGGEYWLGNMIALRSGYRFNYEEGNVALGIGLNFEVAGVKTFFDYAYVNYDYLDSPNRFTVTFSF